MVNRPVSSLALPFPVFEGGPCPSPGVVILHGHPDWVDAEAAPEGPVAGPEAAPGIFIGDASCLSRAAKPHPGKTVLCRVYRGFAGWEGGQLERELADGVWGVVPANGPLLFDTPSEELWDRLAPPAIPQPSLN